MFIRYDGTGYPLYIHEWSGIEITLGVSIVLEAAEEETV